MKKALLTFFLGACALVASAQSVASNVAGEYTGDIWIGLGAPVDTTNQDTRLPDQHVTITAGETEGTINFSLPNFQFGGSPVGDIELNTVPVFLAETGYVNFGDNPAVPLSLAGGIIQATAQINTAESFINGNMINAKIDVVWTNGGNLPINVLFKGVKSVPDGIENITANDAATGTYTLSGVCLNTTGSTDDLPAGIYIINGKKTIIK